MEHKYQNGQNSLKNTYDTVALLAINYVRTFTDTWSYLISATSVFDNGKSLFQTCGTCNMGRDDFSNNLMTGLNPSTAVQDWKTSLNLCNPLLRMTDEIEITPDDNACKTVHFKIEIDEKSGRTHMAVILFALDSFLSLLASSQLTYLHNTYYSSDSVDATKRKQSSEILNSSFNLFVPENAKPEDLLPNTGFPMGKIGPFKRWDSNLKIITQCAQQMDSAELGRTLSNNRRMGIGSKFSVNSTRLTSAELHHKHEIEINKRNQTMLSLKKKRNDDGGDREYCPKVFGNHVILSQNNENEETNKCSLPTRKRTRRKCDTIVNPITFVEKYANNKQMSPKVPATLSVSGGVIALGTKIPKSLISKKFSSFIMSPKECDSSYESCLLLRGHQRTKSLFGKYIMYHRRFCSIANKEENVWIWRNPKDRKIIIVKEQQGKKDQDKEKVCGGGIPFYELAFKVTCRNSKDFKNISKVATGAKNWIRSTIQLADSLHAIEKFVPQMGLAASIIETNLKKTAISVLRGIRPNIGFRYSDNNKNWLPGKWNSPMFSMGVTSERHLKIIEVLDCMMSGGAFLSSTLNNAFFLENGIKPPENRNTWLHIDLIRIASLNLKHVMSLERCCPSCTKAKKKNNNNNGGSKVNERKRYDLIPPTLESEMNTIIQNFQKISFEYRQNRTLKKQQSDISDMISINGALSTLKMVSLVKHKRKSYLSSTPANSKKWKLQYQN